jgi:ribosomal protein S17E
MNVITRFKNVQKFEDIIVDIMRLRKTYFAFMFLNYVVMHCSFDEFHKFTLIFISSEIVLNQWMKTIRNHFSNLKFIIAHDKRTNSKYVDSWIKTTTMKKIFKKLFHWSSKFENVFEQNKRSVSRTMILFIYDIFVNRIVNIVSEWWFWDNQKEEEHFFEDVNSMY